MIDRKLLLRGSIFFAAFTACYGVIRLVRQDEWRWDHLIQTYAGMAFGFFIVGSLFRKRPDHG